MNLKQHFIRNFKQYKQNNNKSKSIKLTPQKL